MKLIQNCKSTILQKKKKANQKTSLSPLQPSQEVDRGFAPQNQQGDQKGRQEHCPGGRRRLRGDWTAWPGRSDVAEVRAQGPLLDSQNAGPGQKCMQCAEN